jgi:hypothetical protein
VAAVIRIVLFRNGGLLLPSGEQKKRHDKHEPVLPGCQGTFMAKTKKFNRQLPDRKSPPAANGDGNHTLH